MKQSGGLAIISSSLFVQDSVLHLHNDNLSSLIGDPVSQ